MPVHITWYQILVRLALTFVAGGAIGLNRGEHGHAAGLRTTLLVCMAASVAMIQANLLMPTSGKSADSFVVLDLMRLPLGILTGVGFIGAGAILRRNELVFGVTTAATLWFVTVVGLCFGGGQLELGSAATIIGLIALWGLKPLEELFLVQRRGILSVVADAEGPAENEMRAALNRPGYRIISWAPGYLNLEHRRELRCELQWRNRNGNSQSPPIVEDLAARPGIISLHWRPAGRN
jgi:putative Mg2+ transporter-C (MgtC) family protein